MQTHCPDHYRFGPLQARDIIEQVIGPIRDSVRAYHTATALKYLLRHTRKAGVGDLLKCRDHLNWAIARAQGVPNERAPDSVTWRHGDIDAACGASNQERASVQSGTHPMHSVALEMAEASIRKQTVADEPWEHAP